MATISSSFCQPTSANQFLPSQSQQVSSADTKSGSEEIGIIQQSNQTSSSLEDQPYLEEKARIERMEEESKARFVRFNACLKRIDQNLRACTEPKNSVQKQQEGSGMINAKEDAPKDMQKTIQASELQESSKQIAGPNGLENCNHSIKFGRVWTIIKAGQNAIGSVFSAVRKALLCWARSGLWIGLFFGALSGLLIGQKIMKV